MKTFNLFIPLTKVDEEKREVYGIATAEIEDKSGEIFDYESSLHYYKEWSGEIQKASGGKSLGNVREMHTNIAAGKVTQIDFNDAKKQIEICAKIVNDSTWEKVMEGVLTGFSHGGEYIKTWKDPANPKVLRYTAKPSEISVVDNPCLGAATFELVRADGAREMRKFKTKETIMKPADEEGIVQGFLKLSDATFHLKREDAGDNAVQGFHVAADKSFHIKKEMAVERHKSLLAKAAVTAVAAPALNALAELTKAVEEKEAVEPGSAEDPMTLGKKEFSDERRKKLAETGAALPDGSFPIESVQDLKNAIHAYGRASDKAKAKAHIIARAKALGEESLIPDDWKEKPAAKSVMPKIKKGMTEIARTACMLQDMEWLANCLTYEAEAEKDNSPLPNEFKDIITRMCSFLEALVEEECRELATPHAVELMGADTMEMAAGLPKDTATALVKHVSKVVANANPADKILELTAALSKAASGETVAKAGARHSASDKAHLAKAAASIDEASDYLDAAKKHHGNVAKAHESLRSAHAEMTKAYDGAMECMKSYGKAEGGDDMHKAMKEHLGKMSEHLDSMDGHMDKAEKHHGKMAKSHDGMAAAHDAAHHALKAVGAIDADSGAEKNTTGDMNKSADDLALLKTDLTTTKESLTATQTENAELKKALETINGQIPALVDRVKKLESQPMPPKGAVFPVHKGHEAKSDPDKPVEAPTSVTYGASPGEMRALLNI